MRWFPNNALVQQLYRGAVAPHIHVPTKLVNQFHISMVSELAGESLEAVTGRFLQYETARKYAPCAPKEAAVLVPLFEDADGVVRVILTERSRFLSKHAGEVAFPGGKRDPSDNCIQQTALREAQEEMGLDPNRVKVLAQLSPILSRYHLSVTPIIGVVPASVLTSLVPSPTEVDSIFTVPLHYFIEDHPRHSYQDAEMGTFRYRIHHFTHEMYDIWGLTGGILIRVAEIGFGQPAEFDVVGPLANYDDLFFDGNKVCIRDCTDDGDVCFLGDGKSEHRPRTRSQTAIRASART